ncbi:helix-turn-helix domain-containing protein [Kitasatospora sp. NBC_01560]|uniref:helix-turn-helix domain-containing protein n=1 Tax=Kitasatospora sp. NBC_01560 TaxID=2975965 RepID=UPI0038671D4B
MQSKGGTVHQRQLGTVIRAARCAQRMTQAQLGRACGYSAAAISRVEAGLLRPAPEPLVLMARALDLPVDTLGVGRRATLAQVELYWIGVHTALGTPDEGVPYAARIAPGQLPTAERRARFGTDCARMWHQLGDQRRTFGALRFTEQVAPEEVRRPALRALTADLLYASVTVPGVRELATRTGIS